MKEVEKAERTATKFYLHWQRYADLLDAAIEQLAAQRELIDALEGLPRAATMINDYDKTLDLLREVRKEADNSAEEFKTALSRFTKGNR